MRSTAQLFGLCFAATTLAWELDQARQKAEDGRRISDFSVARPSGDERRRVGHGEGGGVRRWRGGGGESGDRAGDREPEEGFGGFVLRHESWTEGNERNESGDRGIDHSA